MIYVRDKGQMCNNLLQFAHVWAFAREHGREAVSMRLCYKYPWFALSRDRRHNGLRYALAKGAAAAGLMLVVAYNTPGERNAVKEARILSSRNVMVEGWEVRFYDLFLKYRGELRRMFAFLPEVEAHVRRELESREPRAESRELVTGNREIVRVGLHVRRGDYARWQGGRYYFSDAQYAGVVKRALRLLEGKDVELHICSNDPELDAETYRRTLPGVTVTVHRGNPAEDLCLLSHCDFLLGAPSTFSLMAAFYEDVPLYWIKDPAAEVTAESFGKFERLFKEII